MSEAETTLQKETYFCPSILPQTYRSNRMISLKNKPPFFSVIITTYNRAELLNRALQSLLSQSETDWEALIIDDGSTDNTVEIVSPYLETEKLYYKAQENKGFIEAKNVGIQKARGRYLTFLDSDDEYAPHHLKIRKRILTKERDIDLLQGGVKVIGEEYVPDSNAPERQIHLSECAISGTFFIKTEIMDQLHGFQGTALTTDADFMERAKRKKFHIKTTDFPTYIYHREKEDSVTKKLMKKVGVKTVY